MNNPTQQYDYHHWANNRFFEHLKDLPEDIYDQEIQSVFPSISQVITHIYQVDAMWLSVMSGDSFEKTMTKINETKKQVANKDWAQMQELFADLAKQFHIFFDDVDDFNNTMSIKHPEYGELKTTVAQLVQHVVNHGTYHRGNITAMLRQQDHPGIATDYIFYLYEKA